MNKKKLLKIFPVVAASMIMMISKSFATTEEKIVEDTTNNNITQVINEASFDTTAPVFDANIQSRYIVKMEKDGSKFIPEDVIKDIKAIDDVDGEDVEIDLVENVVDLSLSGEYHVTYSATDKSGNVSYYVVLVIVDGIAPVFEENIENLYYINSEGIILDSNYNVVESLPKTLKATDSVGAFKGIGVCISTDSEGNIVFIDTIENTPAAEKIQANDVLIAVNGEDVCGQTPDFVATKIRGEEGTDVQLDIIRNGEKLSLTIERQVVKMYEDIDYLAEPTVEIESIDFKQDGVIEITYKATDEVGNSSEFVIKIVIDSTDPELYIEDKKSSEEEKDSEVTTSDPPTEEDIEEDEIEEITKEESEDEVEEGIVEYIEEVNEMEEKEEPNTEVTDIGEDAILEDDEIGEDINI